jgi:hypothetical protein
MEVRKRRNTPHKRRRESDMWSKQRMEERKKSFWMGLGMFMLSSL